MQNYATEVLAKIDERFYLDSKTQSVVNNGLTFEFSGVNTVTIYDIDVVPENNYIRSRTMRYGQLVELGDGVQALRFHRTSHLPSQSTVVTVKTARWSRPSMTLLSDRFVKFLFLQLTSLHTCCGSRLCERKQPEEPTPTNLTASNTFQSVLDRRATLTEAKVPVDKGLTVFVTPRTEAFLWRDPEFKVACDKTKEDRATGKIGEIMGMSIVVVPSSYLPAKTGFLMLSNKVLVRPVKFNSVRTGDGFSFGIDGWVAQGRRYYDVFIPKNKGVGIQWWVRGLVLSPSL